MADRNVRPPLRTISDQSGTFGIERHYAAGVVADAGLSLLVMSSSILLTSRSSFWRSMTVFCRARSFSVHSCSLAMTSGSGPAGTGENPRFP